ncbi:hypothetical protein [Agromyces sp. NPDC049794]|uniref:hypothetical protein n=1 Tax=unclassified Agromyces TaxID=2639701 RepID=UPI0033CBBF8C
MSDAPIRLNAYVLAGDPAWAGESIASYYDMVGRIIVSFDQSYRSWAGFPLSVEDALRRIQGADPEGKVVLLPGDHVAAEGSLMETETAQRQAALDVASKGADWVLQLDTDEILSSPATLRYHIEAADAAGADAVDFPLRDIYAATASGQFLERCGRLWTTEAAYPGPVAVRAGTTLTVARQAGGVPLHRVDVAPRNTDPSHPRDAPVHAVIDRDDAILHMSWVRTETQMLEKSLVSGYAHTFDRSRELARWRWRSRHPWLTTASAPFVRRRFGRFRIVTLPGVTSQES